MCNKYTPNRLILNSLLMAVYACFFSVQLVFGFNAIIKTDSNGFYSSHCAVSLKTFTAVKEAPVKDLKIYNIRLNKRFEPTTATAIFAKSIEIPFYYFVLPTITSYAEDFIPSSDDTTYSLRGPPVVIYLT